MVLPSSSKCLRPSNWNTAMDRSFQTQSQIILKINSDFSSLLHQKHPITVLNDLISCSASLKMNFCIISSCRLPQRFKSRPKIREMLSEVKINTTTGHGREEFSRTDLIVEASQIVLTRKFPIGGSRLSGFYEYLGGILVFLTSDFSC